MRNTAVVVTDRVYTKTRRHLEKVRACLEQEDALYLAIPTGFPSGRKTDFVADLVVDIFEGDVRRISEWVDDIAKIEASGAAPAVIALNQSALLPAIAIQRMLGRASRGGIAASCDKRETRRLLARGRPELSLDYREAIPGVIGSAGKSFSASGYVVKPAFGMSSADVRIVETWQEAVALAEDPAGAKEWLPHHVVEALAIRGGRTDIRIIEPFIAGTEFSLDGWIDAEHFEAIVQHKLCMVHGTFIGDGPTVTPPISSIRLPLGWSPLKGSEAEIREFGAAVLRSIGFCRGVFHMECREQPDGKLKLIEINPRAPGGSLWRTALLRNGYDLELVDAMLQLGKQVSKPVSHTLSHVLHYPLYASRPGKLVDWGDFADSSCSGIPGLTVDFAAELDQEFSEADLAEEPYLAFAVTHDVTADGILEKCQRVLALRQPRIV